MEIRERRATRHSFDCLKPHLLDDHPTESQLPDCPDQSIYFATQAEHLQCSQRILRNVNGSQDRELLYQVGVAEQLVSYTDADWAGNAGNR